MAQENTGDGFIKCLLTGNHSTEYKKVISEMEAFKRQAEESLDKVTNFLMRNRDSPTAQTRGQLLYLEISEKMESKMMSFHEQRQALMEKQIRDVKDCTMRNEVVEGLTDVIRTTASGNPGFCKQDDPIDKLFLIASQLENE